MFYNYQAREAAYMLVKAIASPAERQQALEAFIDAEKELLRSFSPPKLPSMLLKQAERALRDIVEPRIVGDVANVARVLF